MSQTQIESPRDSDAAQPAATDVDGYHAPHPLVQLVLARVREFYREPEAVFWVYGFPILMAVALGIAFRNRPAENISVVVIDGPAAQAVADVLRNVPAVQPAGASDTASTAVGAAAASRFDVQVLDEAQAADRLRTGKTPLVIAPTAAADGDAPLDLSAVEYRYDPSRPESAPARMAVDDALQRAAGRVDPVAQADETRTEPGGRYIDFLIPGLLGASLMGGGLWGIGFVTVDMRVRNLLKRFVTTPMRKSHFLAGLMLSRFFFMVTEVVVLLLFARWAFGAAMLGSWLLLLALIVLGSWTFAGVGLLVASRAKTLETASGLMNLVLVPMWIFSGIFFSNERFPDAAQPVINALPLTPLIHALRSVMLEGATLTSLTGDVVILAAWGAGTFWVALRIFRWY